MLFSHNQFSSTDNSLHYFLWRRIFAALDASAAYSSKSLLGAYHSPAMSSLSKALRQYESDNAHLAEAGAILARLCTMEVPAARKDVERAEKSATECERKAKQLNKAAAEARRRFADECERMKLEPESDESLEEQLRRQLVRLPEMFDRIALEMRVLREALECYCSFVEMTSKRYGGNFPVPIIFP